MKPDTAYSSCNKCKALEGTPKAWACGLGYKIDTEGRRPQEPCPKPRNLMALIKEQKRRKK